MSLFTAEDRRSLKAEFPKRNDLESVLASIERKAQSETVTSPMGLARSWLNREPARPVVVGSRNSEPEARPPGAFNLDGSWDSHAWTTNDHTHAIWKLCATRRNRDWPPSAYVPLIQQLGIESMFNPKALEQWGTITEPDKWHSAWTWRSSESAIKYAGYGSSHHWHGQGRIVSGESTKCDCKNTTPLPPEISDKLADW